MAVCDFFPYDLAIREPLFIASFNEPAHEITVLIGSSCNEGSDKSALRHRLVRTFAARINLMYRCRFKLMSEVV